MKKNIKIIADEVCRLCEINGLVVEEIKIAPVFGHIYLSQEKMALCCIHHDDSTDRYYVYLTNGDWTTYFENRIGFRECDLVHVKVIEKLFTKENIENLRSKRPSC